MRIAVPLALFVFAAGCSTDGKVASTTSEETSVITTTIPVITTTAVSAPEPTTTTEPPVTTTQAATTTAPSVTTTTEVRLPLVTAEITFLFDQDTVPVDDQDRVRQEVPLVIDFYERLLGRELQEVVWIMSSSEEWVVDAWKEFFGIQAPVNVEFRALPKAVLAPLWWSNVFGIAHELFHLLEYQLSGVESFVGCENCVVEPTWMLEGAASYYGVRYASSRRNEDFQDRGVFR